MSNSTNVKFEFNIDKVDGKYRMLFGKSSLFVILPESYIESKSNHQYYKQSYDAIAKESASSSNVYFDRSERINPNLLDRNIQRPSVMKRMIESTLMQGVIPLNVLVYLIEYVARGSYVATTSWGKRVIESLVGDIMSAVTVTLRILNTVKLNEIMSYKSMDMTDNEITSVVPIDGILANLRYRMSNVVNHSDKMSSNFRNMPDETVIADLPFNLKTAILPYAWQQTFTLDLYEHIKLLNALNMQPGLIDPNNPALIEYSNNIGVPYNVTPQVAELYNIMRSSNAHSQLINKTITQNKVTYSGNVMPAGYYNVPSKMWLLHMCRQIVSVGGVGSTNPGEYFNEYYESLKVNTRGQLLRVFTYLLASSNVLKTNRMSKFFGERTLSRRLYYIDSVAGSGKTSLVQMIYSSLSNDISLIFCCDTPLNFAWDKNVKVCTSSELKEVVTVTKFQQPTKPIVVFFDEFCMEIKEGMQDLECFKIDEIDVLILSGATIPQLDQLPVPDTYAAKRMSANVFHTYANLTDINGRTANPLALNQHYDKYLLSPMPMLRRFISREVIERTHEMPTLLTDMQTECHDKLTQTPTHNKLFMHHKLSSRLDWLKAIAHEAHTSPKVVVVFCTEYERQYIPVVLDSMLRFLREGLPIDNMDVNDYVDICIKFDSNLSDTTSNLVDLIDRVSTITGRSVMGGTRSGRRALINAGKSATKLNRYNDETNHRKHLNRFKFLRFVKEFAEKSYDHRYNLYIGSEKTAYGLNYKNLECVYITPEFGATASIDTVLQAMARAGRKGMSSYARIVIGHALKYRLQLETLNSQDSIIVVVDQMNKLTLDERMSTEFETFIKGLDLNIITTSVLTKLAYALSCDQLYFEPATNDVHTTLLNDAVSHYTAAYEKHNVHVTNRELSEIFNRTERPGAFIVKHSNNPNGNPEDTYGYKRYMTSGASKTDYIANKGVPLYSHGTCEYQKFNTNNNVHRNRILKEVGMQINELNEYIKRSGTVNNDVQLELQNAKDRQARITAIKQMPHLSVEDVYEYFVVMRDNLRSYALMKVRSGDYINRDIQLRIVTESIPVKLPEPVPFNYNQYLK